MDIILFFTVLSAVLILAFAIVLNESKAEYIQALIDTCEKDDISIFRSFMRDEYQKHFTEEIEKRKRV